MLVALYIRCSAEEQATEGLTIEGQRSVLTQSCRVRAPMRSRRTS